MYAGIDRLASLLHKKIGDHYTIQLQYEPGSADLYVFGSPKNTEGYQFLKTFFGVIFANNPN